MPCYLIGEVHEWINKILCVPIYHFQLQSIERQIIYKCGELAFMLDYLTILCPRMSITGDWARFSVLRNLWQVGPTQTSSHRRKHTGFSSSTPLSLSMHIGRMPSKTMQKAEKVHCTYKLTDFVWFNRRATPRMEAPLDTLQAVGSIATQD